jgi:hypothetical protein
MPRNYSVKETIRRVRERELQKQSERIDTSETTVADSIEEIPQDHQPEPVIQSQEEVKTEEYVERFDHQEEQVKKKKDTIIQSITKKFKWW